MKISKNAGGSGSTKVPMCLLEDGQHDKANERSSTQQEGGSGRELSMSMPQFVPRSLRKSKPNKALAR